MIRNLLKSMGMLALLAITCCSSSAEEPKPETKRKLTIMSYNIHHGAPADVDVINLENIANVIRKSGAEIIALQEVDVKTDRSNKIDQAKELNAQYNSQVRMRELIRRERQAELAFEGGRYFDIRRWEIDNEVLNGQVYGATNPATGEITRVQTRKYNRNRELLWPIPEVELIPNKNMVQNPNY